jgi:hypothetical protein
LSLGQVGKRAHKIKKEFKLFFHEIAFFKD